MSEAKIQVKIGEIDFLGEGEEKWVAAQLDKILAQAKGLQASTPTPPPMGVGGSAGHAKADSASHQTGTSDPLGTFLKVKNVGTNQVNRFLATAIWLASRGSDKPTTQDVTNALKENHQQKLKNPADCLNKNVKKGFCEKVGKQFFVTPSGFESMQ